MNFEPIKHFPTDGYGLRRSDVECLPKLSNVENSETSN